jgi:hypothetical protein
MVFAEYKISSHRSIYENVSLNILNEGDMLYRYLYCEEKRDKFPTESFKFFSKSLYKILSEFGCNASALFRNCSISLSRFGLKRKFIHDIEEKYNKRPITRNDEK